MIGWYKINDSVRRLLSLSAISTCLVILSSCEPEPEPALLYNDNVIPFEIVEETFRLGARSTAWISNKSVIFCSLCLGITRSTQLSKFWNLFG